MKTLLISAILALAPVSAHANPAPTADQEQSDQMLVQMKERLKQMQALVQQLEKTSDPAERRKLLTEHMRAMHKGMDSMRGMGGGMMMGMMASDADHRGHAHVGSPSPDIMQRRMDMMQMMMEQMMQHMQACQPAEKP